MKRLKRGKKLCLNERNKKDSPYKISHAHLGEHRVGVGAWSVGRSGRRFRGRADLGGPAHLGLASPLLPFLRGLRDACLTDARVVPADLDPADVRCRDDLLELGGAARMNVVHDLDVVVLSLDRLLGHAEPGQGLDQASACRSESRLTESLRATAELHEFLR